MTDSHLPLHTTDLLVSKLSPQNGTIYDHFCAPGKAYSGIVAFSAKLFEKYENNLSCKNGKTYFGIFGAFSAKLFEKYENNLSCKNGFIFYLQEAS